MARLVSSLTTAQTTMRGVSHGPPSRATGLLSGGCKRVRGLQRQDELSAESGNVKFA
jgi:hypothetical protein